MTGVPEKGGNLDRDMRTWGRQCEETRKKTTFHKSKSEALNRSFPHTHQGDKSYQHLDLRFPGKTFLLFKLSSLWYFVKVNFTN